MARTSQPIFNLPPVVAALSALLVFIHVLRAAVDEETDLQFLLWLAFVPARYDMSLPVRLPLPGEWAADAWTFVTYALLHGDAMHLIVNLVWFLAFGSAVAWRFGAFRFTAFFAVTAAAGALAHLLLHWGEFVPLVGASAAISGCMAAAIRFIFEAGGPLGIFCDGSSRAYSVPAAPLSEVLRNPQVLVFLGVWFVINLGFGLGTLDELVGNGTVAWEAHVGGFLAGLLLFPFFDPVRARE
ncbi:MAG: rhomboid family intramembrane serine protease [Bradyrhizobiaceae bacterium]|nr:rhomboid family intramembrane serine protease [Bradyrhizobiaceae bacterium]